MIIQTINQPLKDQASAAMKSIWALIRNEGLHDSFFGFVNPPLGVASLPEVRNLVSGAINTFASRPDGNWDEPQVLFRLPDYQNEKIGVQYEPHIDKDSSGNEYYEVLGIALTDGVTLDFMDRGRRVLRQGDIVSWSGNIQHAGTPNETDAIKAVIYVRRFKDR